MRHHRHPGWHPAPVHRQRDHLQLPSGHGAGFFRLQAVHLGRNLLVGRHPHAGVFRKNPHRLHGDSPCRNRQCPALHANPDRRAGDLSEIHQPARLAGYDQRAEPGRPRHRAPAVAMQRRGHRAGVPEQGNHLHRSHPSHLSPVQRQCDQQHHHADPVFGQQWHLHSRRGSPADLRDTGRTADGKPGIPELHSGVHHHLCAGFHGPVDDGDRQYNHHGFLGCRHHRCRYVHRFGHLGLQHTARDHQHLPGHWHQLRRNG